MSESTFYHDHWVSIEAERLARYEQMFQFRPQHNALIAPLDLAPGQRGADYGCGPGFLAMEMAKQVGLAGDVFGLDINEQFLLRAADRAREQGLTNLHFQALEGAVAGLPDASLDRVFCKNVLEYVPDVTLTLAEQFRLLKPGGRVQIVDSDWGFVVVEPWGDAKTRTFFAAAAPAFRDPHIGRKLYGLLLDAGFTDVRVAVSAQPDPVGRTLSVVRNMAGYIAEFDSHPRAEITMWLDELETAIADGRYLMILPQFVLTQRVHFDADRNTSTTDEEIDMKKLTTAIALLALLLAGCDEGKDIDRSVERGLDEAQDTVSDTLDNMEDAAEDLIDEAEDIVDELEDAADDIADEAQELADDAGDMADDAMSDADRLRKKMNKTLE